MGLFMGCFCHVGVTDLQKERERERHLASQARAGCIGIFRELDPLGRVG